MTEPTRIPKKSTVVDLDVRVKNSIIDKVVSGSNHTVVLIGGKIFCRGDPEAYTCGRRINERHKTQNSLTFDGVGLSNTVDVWCGGYHTIAKVKKGKGFIYYGWGYNNYGQLGTGDYVSVSYPV